MQIADKEKLEMKGVFGTRKEGCAVALLGNTKFIEETGRKAVQMQIRN